MSDIITQPIKFLNATVLSFNTSLGLGSAQESTLNVDLIEDCESDPPDQFMPAYGLIEVGAPVYFSTKLADNNGFAFGGVLSSWTSSQGASGKVYNVKIVDPRQLLENVVLILDSYAGDPIQLSSNYINIYAAYERQVLDGDCSVFGISGSTERGIPYNSIISKLQQLNPTIKSPTGYTYQINWQSFPQGAPEYYRIPGPSITLLELLSSVCDILGLEFYTDLYDGAFINIGTINMKQAPESFEAISSPNGIFNGIATELSYGQELRNEKTKMLLFGEKQHYLSIAKKFNFYFGEEWRGGEDLVPIIPHRWTECHGFWIRKSIREINLSLHKPLNDIGPFEISENDIRGAMAGFDVWMLRITNSHIEGEFNKKIRDHYFPLADNKMGDKMREIFNTVHADASIAFENKWKAMSDIMNGPNSGTTTVSDLINEDLKALHGFINNLGETYYGKQFFTPLNEKICHYRGEKFMEKIFSAEPTNAGGWVDYGTTVLGLGDPDLNTFRSTDDRIGAFAVFTRLATDAPKPQDDECGDSPGCEEPVNEPGYVTYVPGGGS
jgi:hypothetical protein